MGSTRRFSIRVRGRRVAIIFFIYDYFLLCLLSHCIGNQLLANQFVHIDRREASVYANGSHSPQPYVQLIIIIISF
jgi:hypothetical protein